MCGAERLRESFQSGQKMHSLSFPASVDRTSHSQESPNKGVVNTFWPFSAAGAARVEKYFHLPIGLPHLDLLPCTADELRLPWKKLFDLQVEPCPTLPLQAIVDLGLTMAKGFSRLSKTTGILNCSSFTDSRLASCSERTRVIAVKRNNFRLCHNIRDGAVMRRTRRLSRALGQWGCQKEQNIQLCC